MRSATALRERPAPVAPPVIDPRIEDRRRAVSAEHARRRNRRVGTALALVGVVGGAYALTRSAALDVDRVSVTGVSGPAATEVARRAGVAPGTPLIDVDPAAVAHRVEKLVWVSDATVERHWPGGVTIEVVARQPVAVDRRGVALAADGSVLGSGVPGGSRSLPRVDIVAGRTGSTLASPMATVVEVLAAVPDHLRADVVEGAVRGSDVVLTLDDGITVRIGGPDRLVAKFVAVGALLEQADRETIEAIDVRVPSSPSVRPRKGTDRAADASLTDPPKEGA